MALIKNKDEREIALLEQLEQQIARRERRRRIIRIAAGAATLLAVAAIVTGHSLCCTKECGKHTHRR